MKLMLIPRHHGHMPIAIAPCTACCWHGGTVINTSVHSECELACDLIRPLTLHTTARYVLFGQVLLPYYECPSRTLHFTMPFAQTLDRITKRPAQICRISEC